MIEETLYQRLATDTELAALCPRMRPSEPELNEDLPHLHYTFSGREQSTTFDGQSNLVNHSFTVDVYTLNAADLPPIVDRLNELLNGWRAGVVRWCRNTGHMTDQQEKGFHAQESYSMWATAG